MARSGAYAQPSEWGCESWPEQRIDHRVAGRGLKLIGQRADPQHLGNQRPHHVHDIGYGGVQDGLGSGGVVRKVLLIQRQEQNTHEGHRE